MWEYVQYLNAELLDLKLWGEGCRLYQIRQMGDDEICLIQTDDSWQVVYAERGAVQQLLFEFTDEAEACEFMYREIKRIKHPHLVGLFQTDAEAEQFCQALTQLQIQFSHDAKGRVRVYDRDIFLVERHFGCQLPLRKWLTAQSQ
jgi:hypothetical protein